MRYFPQTFTQRVAYAFGRCVLSLSFVLIFGLIQGCQTAEKPRREPLTIDMRYGWNIQSSTLVAKRGEVISRPSYAPLGWYSTSVPTTVLAALVENGVYKDIFVGKNLATIPTVPFESSWWYRREFTLPDSNTFSTARLIFEGINYSANIYLNGRRVETVKTIAGTYRIFDLDVTASLHPGKNILAVEVFPPKKGDFTLGFVDWNPMPADKNMGLFRPVKLALAGPVTINHPYVNSEVDTATLDKARLTVSAEITNNSDSPVNGVVRGAIGHLIFHRAYTLNAHETQTVVFKPEDNPQLILNKPKLWWPAGMGEPALHTLKMRVEDSIDQSDSKTITFGIRDVKDYINEQGHRGYTINGRKVLIRGGGWQDELLLRENDKNLDAQMRYTLHMNLNAIRLEGIWGSSQKLYDLADKYGILLLPGWSCQWEWTDYAGRPMPDKIYGGPSSKEDMDLIQKYFRDQVLWLRHHPSILAFGVGSDKLPYPEMEKRYRSDIAELSPSWPLLTASANHKSEISGDSAVKMKGPYFYVPPDYWYLDKENGGAFGFNTETGPGPQPPVFDSIKKMIPADKLWPINDTWNFHCGRKEFQTLDHYIFAFNKRYGAADSAEEFSFRAQAANYEAMRPMYEAFILNKPVTTGIIQWMHNASWPKFYWQLYDYYLMPTGAFYGARKGNQPVNLIYDYGQKSVSIVNQTLTDQPNLEAVIELYDLNSKQIMTRTIKVDALQDSAKKILDLPTPSGVTPVYFLAMTLKGKSGSVVADNFYWLSTSADVLDFKKSNWYSTPSQGWANFTALNTLPKVELKSQQRMVTHGKEQEMTVTLTNPSEQIAFFIELNVRGDKTGNAIAPIFWDDNYFSLLPGQSKILRATFATEDLADEKPVLSYQGWNVRKK